MVKIAVREFTISDPEGRQLHRVIRLDPEAGWDALRARLCESGVRDELFFSGLVEDLMDSNADQLIDRLERLVEECPHARETIASAHAGGVASTPAQERFWSLHERLGGNPWG